MSNADEKQQELYDEYLARERRASRKLFLLRCIWIAIPIAIGLLIIVGIWLSWR